LNKLHKLLGTFTAPKTLLNVRLPQSNPKFINRCIKPAILSKSVEVL